MRRGAVLPITVLVILGLALSASAVFAVTLPDTFSGTLTIDGSPAPASTEIRGTINGIDRTFNSPFFSSAGSYSQLKVSGTDDELGETITFIVECNNGFVPADQTKIFLGGRFLTLNLTATCNGEQCIPTAEVCDGIDNDCDGAIDEGFNVGQACSAGVGACLAQGTFQCTIDGLGTECNAVPGVPAEEVCNAIDDDCDGATDEGEVCQEDFCIVISDMRILDSDFNEAATIEPGTMYNIEVSNTNVCLDPVTSMQIVQVKKDQTVVNLGTVKSTIAPGDTSVVTVGFILAGNANMGDAYTATAFNWNKWISQPGPPPFAILSETSSTGFTVA